MINIAKYFEKVATFSENIAKFRELITLYNLYTF